jgi:ribosome-binding ATPase YchF (GTP1/OBG family)
LVSWFQPIRHCCWDTPPLLGAAGPRENCHLFPLIVSRILPAGHGPVKQQLWPEFSQVSALPRTANRGLGRSHYSRETGHYRIEGRDYIVLDGDVLLFKFNV